MNLPVELLASLVLATIAVFVELPTGKIPNWLCYSAIVLGLILAGTQERLTTHFVGLLVVGVLSIACFSQQLMPGGTSKLLMATAAVGGLSIGVITFLLVFVVILTTLAVSKWTDPSVAHASDQPPASYQWKFPSSPLILATSIAYGALWSWNHMPR